MGRCSHKCMANPTLHWLEREGGVKWSLQLQMLQDKERNINTIP